MRFNFKATNNKKLTSDGKPQYVMETAHAKSEQELISLYNTLGYDQVEIIECDESEDEVQQDYLDEYQQRSMKQLEAQAKLLCGQSVPGVQNQPINTNVGRPDAYKEFEDNGSKYRINLSTQKVEKYTIQELSDAEKTNFKMQRGDGNISSIPKNVKLYQYKWCSLGQ